MVNTRPIDLMCLVVTSVILQRTRSPPGQRLPKRIGDTHPRNHILMGKDVDIHFFDFLNRGIINLASLGSDVDQ